MVKKNPRGVKMKKRLKNTVHKDSSVTVTLCRGLFFFYIKN